MMAILSHSLSRRFKCLIFAEMYGIIDMILYIIGLEDCYEISKLCRNFSKCK